MCVYVCVCVSTCHIKFDLQGELGSDGRVSEQLIGLFQGGVFGRNPVNGQNPVPNLQDATPAHTHTHTHTLSHSELYDRNR